MPVRLRTSPAVSTTTPPPPPSPAFAACSSQFFVTTFVARILCTVCTVGVLWGRGHACAASHLARGFLHPLSQFAVCSLQFVVFRSNTCVYCGHCGDAGMPVRLRTSPAASSTPFAVCNVQFASCTCIVHCGVFRSNLCHLYTVYCVYCGHCGDAGMPVRLRTSPAAPSTPFRSLQFAVCSL